MTLGIMNIGTNRSTYYWKTWLQFVFPLFIICRYHHRMSYSETSLGHVAITNVVPGLVTISLISYKK